MWCVIWASYRFRYPCVMCQIGINIGSYILVFCDVSYEHHIGLGIFCVMIYVYFRYHIGLGICVMSYCQRGINIGLTANFCVGSWKGKTTHLRSSTEQVQISNEDLTLSVFVMCHLVLTPQPFQPKTSKNKDHTLTLVRLRMVHSVVLENHFIQTSAVKITFVETYLTITWLLSCHIFINPSIIWRCMRYICRLRTEVWHIAFASNVWSIWRFTAKINHQSPIDAWEPSMLLRWALGHTEMCWTTLSLEHISQTCQIAKQYVILKAPLWSGNPCYISDLCHGLHGMSRRTGISMVQAGPKGWTRRGQLG